MRYNIPTKLIEITKGDDRMDAETRVPTEEMYARTVRLIGQDGFDRLRRAHVCLFGVGGVGGAAAEALVRAGIGKITLVDPDTVAASNLNRQLVATQDTVGMPKTAAAERRLHAIDPDCTVIERRTFYLPENANEFDFAEYDYVLDAIDTVSAKLSIVAECKKAGTPVICAMGTGNKLTAEGMTVTYIEKTHTCPLAAVMRRELKKRGIKKVKVVYSPVPPVKPAPDPTAGKKQPPASISFVPPVCGYLMAGEVVRDLLRDTENEGSERL